jgi:putative endonuclease
MAVRARHPDHGERGTAPHLALGAWGERLAERRYRTDGYRVLARNWRCPSGEIDLILERGGLVVFSEVKTRSSTAFGWPAEAVDRRRQARLRAAAATWIRSTGACPGEVRFDVVSVLPGRVERLEGAF